MTPEQAMEVWREAKRVYVTHVTQDQAAAAVIRKAVEAETLALREENEVLKSLVRGWHYLAVGPDERGDYYTQKQLIKASEPYALRALLADQQEAGDA